MRRYVAFAAVYLSLSGCQAIGAKGFLTDVAALKDLPPELIDKVSICQAADGTFAGDGVYTNTTANGVSLVEFNGGCDRVTSLPGPRGPVQFQAADDE